MRAKVKKKKPAVDEMKEMKEKKNDKITDETMEKRHDYEMNHDEVDETMERLRKADQLTAIFEEYRPDIKKQDNPALYEEEKQGFEGAFKNFLKDLIFLTKPELRDQTGFSHNAAKNDFILVLETCVLMGGYPGARIAIHSTTLNPRNTIEKLCCTLEFFVGAIFHVVGLITGFFTGLFLGAATYVLSFFIKGVYYSATYTADSINKNREKEMKELKNQFTKRLEEREEFGMCSICQEEFVDDIGNTIKKVVSNCCKQIFHSKCYDDYIISMEQKKEECPLCKGEIGNKPEVGTVSPIVQIDDDIDLQNFI